MKKTMKVLWLILKIILAPGFAPLWLLWKCRYALLALMLLDGCATTSNTFEKSPCACQFEPLNVEDGNG